MKKLITLLITIITAFTLVACGGNQNSDSKPSDSKESTQQSQDSNTEDEDDDLEYTVNLLLNGEAYKESAVQIQLCAKQCLLPSPTDTATGSVTFVNDRKTHIDPEEIYHVHVYEGEKEFLAKYAYNINKYSVYSNNKSVSIELIERKVTTEGDGTKANPYKISALGAYTLEAAAKGFKNFEFTASKTGKISIEGFGEQITSIEQVNTSIVLLDKNGAKVSEVKTGGIGKNFKHEMDVVEGTTYKFAIGAIADSVFPAKFDFAITEVK